MAKRIVWTEQAKADIRAIEQPIAIQILKTLGRYALTGEGAACAPGPPRLLPRQGRSPQDRTRPRPQGRLPLICYGALKALAFESPWQCIIAIESINLNHQPAWDTTLALLQAHSYRIVPEQCLPPLVLPFQGLGSLYRPIGRY